MPAEAAPSWLWIAELGAAGDVVTLTAQDVHYLLRVCRARVGDRVTATDGRGVVAALRLEAGSPLAGRIETVERRERSREAWLLCGAPERGRADWMIEKLAELGVAVFQPVDCARGRWESGARPDRWRRVAVAGLRQARSPFLLEIRRPVGLEEATTGLPSEGSRWLADPAGPGGRAAGAAAGPAIGAVGPAAGFDESEWSLLRARGFEPMSLSGNRLRTETAAIAWAAWWSAG